MSFLEHLQQRFPQSGFETLVVGDRFNIIRFDVQFRGKKYFVICTDGLWKYRMPVTPKYEGKEHIELSVCVEDDWDFEEENNQWIPEKLEWLGNFLLDRKTWFGAGHTIPNGNPPKPLSRSVTQDHFFFDEATYMHEIFNPFYIDETPVNFLFLIPVSKDELDYKHKKSTFVFKRKLANKNVHEVIEEFRPSIITRRWKLW